MAKKRTSAAAAATDKKKSKAPDVNKIVADAFPPADETTSTPIPKEFETLDLYWKASNYLAVAQVRCSV